MADKIKQPVTRGVAKVPIVMQLEALECGAACLTMILAYYGRWIPLEQLYFQQLHPEKNCTLILEALP